MNNDYYDLLDIPENATPTSITRAYEQCLQLVETDPALDQAQRASAAAELGKAYRTLSSPLRKEEYDARRRKQRESAEKAKARRGLLRRGLLLIGLPVLGIGVYLGYQHRQTELALREQARDAAERAQKRLEFQRQMQERQAALEREGIEARRLDDERIERERQSREVEQRGKRFEADALYKPQEQLAQERFAREQALRRKQAQDELDRTRAALEAERQKRLRESPNP